MAKQLNVNVSVTADTSAAKAQLESLQTTLSQLSSSSTNLHLGLNTSELNKAISDVDKLSAHLKNATGTNGVLDFGKLNTSIQQSGSSLQAYGNQLLKLGPQGQQAFNQLTQAIAKSEIPMSRMKGLLGEFGTVLKNTVKWQAASSAIHGMMGSIQHAFSYAQQLNKSLNNIQIVTNLSDEKMAKFAESANKAAKSLSTTTTKYTDAALIYYQQGIRDDQEIAKRVETTIKLANVSGQSAEKVSNQMTAIWNNFAKGGDNLERYADVITALGAATASSSEEIATGLSKFAAVADTVGLSYDHATAALATITATTRQSADTVGTGLRTLFARLQSLNLGETLDDGVTLTKYTKALEKIGVSVIDAAGNMRSMDAILDDMGQKWQTLTDAQKTATAQTVGGVRQYTTLMALMENYDFYQDNIKIAANAEGTVQAQADIYAKSWEAAQKRVKASAESIYSDLINDDFFISLNNGFAGFLDILDKIIDGFGGLKTLIPMIGAALTHLFSTQIASGMVNFANSLATFKPGYAKQQANIRDAYLANAAATNIGISPGQTLNRAQAQQLAYSKADLQIQRNYAQNASTMSDMQRLYAQLSMDRFSNLRNAYMQQAQQITTSRNNQLNARSNLVGANSTGLNIYTRQQNMDRVAQQQYNQAVEFARLQNAGGPNAPQYFTGKGNNVGTWFASNGQFLKSNYDLAFQRSGDLGAFTKGINSRQDEIAILQNLKDTGYQGLGAAIKGLKGLTGKGTGEILNDLRQRGIVDTHAKTIDQSALNSQIGIITEEQDKMVTDFAAKWGKSRESVMKYKDAIVATNGDLKKQEELNKQMDQAEKQGLEATKKNSQIQKAQQIVKYAQAMQGAVATGQSLASVTQNIVTNLENGGSVFDNFGQTLSGVTSGFMSASMVMAAIPGPVGIAIAAISALIGVLSKIPAVTDFFHKLFTSEDQLALEQAQKNAELIQNEFETAKQKADEFLSATGAHNQLLEEINKCTQGTAAFKQAVIEANAYAKQMMQDYNLTLDDFTRNTKTGALELNADAVENRQRTLEANRDNLEIMAAYSQYEVKRAQLQKANNSLNAILSGAADGKSDTGGSYYGGGWNAAGTPTVQELIDDYVASGVTDTFEEYAKSRGYNKTGTGVSSVYGKMKKQLQELGYASIDEFIQAQQDYGDASSIKFDGIVSDLFKNIATSKVFNENNDLELSSFLSSYLGTSENGDLIRDASLSDWISKNDEAQQSVLDALLNGDQHLDLTNLDADQLWNNANYLREFLTQVGSFDAAAVREMSLTDLKTNAQSLLSAQQGIQLFEQNYETLANDPLVKKMGEIGQKSQKEQHQDTAEVQQKIKELDDIKLAQGSLSESDQLLYDYYTHWMESFEQAKTAMAENAAKLFFGDEAFKDDTTAQEKLTQELKDIISNSSLTDAEVAETLNLGKQIKNVLGEAFSPDQFKGLFTSSDLTDMYKSIDWTSQVSAFFDVARMKERIGSAGTEISAAINDLYATLLDESHLNGEVGLFSQIFGEEDFQKELKKVQKSFKKTGKIGVDEVDDIAKSCDDLNEALDLNILSAGAVADAIELYSMGAIDSIDSISEELWNALERANELTDALREAFQYIDNFNPDRSSGDIGASYGKWSKELTEQLGAGLTGDERTYQIAEFLGNSNVASALRRHFFETETGLADHPGARQAEYQKAYEAYDNMWQAVQKTGNFQPWWSYMLSGDADTLYGESTYVNPETGQVIPKASEALKALGFSTGDNPDDIELDVKKGMTTNDYIEGIMAATGMSHEAAAAFFTEFAGHSQGVTGQLRANEFMTGLDEAALGGEEAIAEYFKAKANDIDAGVLEEALELLGYDEESIRAAVDGITQAQEDLAAKKQEWAEAFAKPESEETPEEEAARIAKRNQLVQDLISENNLAENGQLDVTGGTEAITAMGIATSQANQSMADYIDSVAGTDAAVTQLTGTYTDANGATREFTANLDDLEGETTAEKLANFNQQLEEMSTNVSQANQNLGKDIFAGFLQGIHELSEGTSEWAQQLQESLGGEDFKLEIPVTLKLADDFDATTITGGEPIPIEVTTTDNGNAFADLQTAITNLQNKNIPITITSTVSPDPTSDKGITHIRGDIDEMSAKGAINVAISMTDNGDLAKFKAAKGDFNALVDAAEKLNTPVTLSITLPENLDSQGIEDLANGLEAVKNNSNTEVSITVPAEVTNQQVITDLSTKLEGMRNVQVEIVPPTEINETTIDEFAAKLEAFKSVPVSIHLEPGTTVADMQALLDQLPNKKNVTVSLTMPDGTTFNLGQQGFWQGLVNTNDQSNAQAQLNAATTRYSDYADIGEYHIGPGAGEEYWQAYNEDYNGTGYSVGSVANGAPMRIVTPEMLAEAGLSSLSEVYQSDGNGGVTLTEAGQALMEAAEKSALAADKQAEAAEDTAPPEAAGGNQRREGSGDKGVSINGQEYSLEGTRFNTGYVENLAQQLQSAQARAGDTNLSEQSRQAAQMQADALSQALSDVVTEIKEANPEVKEPEAPSDKSGGETKTNLTVGDTSVEIDAEANITEATYNGPPVPDVPAQLVYEGQNEEGETVQVTVDPDDSALQAELEAQGFKQVTLEPDTAEPDAYMNATGSKIVNLYVGVNEPEAAIAALPSSHSIDLVVNVQVTGGNAFGSSVSFAGGGGIASAAAIGGAIDQAATNYALNHPKMLAFLDETRRHYMEGQEGCQHSKGTCRGGGAPGGASGMATYHSYVNGSANRYSKPGISLTAEEGPEIVWNKQEGYAYIVGGEGHPEFANLRPGDRVFNANDTRQILNYHRPKSNTTSEVKDPREMSDTLFGSHATGSAYGSYGNNSKYGVSRGGGAGTRGSNKREKDYTPERYHLITRQIQDLTFWYEELQKARENAYGTNVLDAIDQEIQATKQLVKANQALLAEAEDYLKKDKQRLKDLGIKAVFDEAGNLANFEELQEKYRKAAESGDDEAAANAWKAIEQYEETLDKVQEAKAELSDALYDFAELRLEKVQVKAEMKIDFDDKEIDYIQHFLDKIDDKIYATADALTLVSSQMGLINNKLDVTHKAIDEVFDGMVDRYGNPIEMTYAKWLTLNAAQREALDINGKYGKQLEEYAENIKTYIEELEKFKTKGVEELSAAFDELNNKVTTQISLYDHYANMLSSLRDLADLQGIKIPKEMRNSIAQLNSSMAQVTNDRITSQKEYYEELSREADEIRKKLESTTDTDLVNKYQAELDKIEQLMRESAENIVQLWQDGLNKAKDIFDQALEWAKEDYEASLSEMYGTSGLLQEAFDRKNDLASEYADDYEKYYQLGKLQRQINKDIDTAAVNGNKANKNLKALLEEIQTLQANGTALSAYDLDILQKKYEYEKALADLEDARNAKQTVRLQRDRNGNWGYVYTAADDADLAEYEQAVEDKLYEYTKAATEQSQDLQSQIISLWAEAGEKVAQMRADGISDAVIDDYIADIQQKLDFLMSQLEKTGTDVELALPKWIKITNDTFNLTTDTFQETILSVVTGMETIQQTGETITDAIMTIADATKQAADDYNESIEALNNLVSGNEEGYTANANAWATAITRASAENIENTHKAVEEMGNMYDTILAKATEFEEAFMATYEPIIRRNEEFLASLINALGQLNGLANNLGILTQAFNTGNNTNYAAPSFDTGGYTGVWGPDGRLAFLHQKEQVFNADDTENLLHAANILKTLDLQTGSFERGLGNFFSPSVKDLNQTIEQQVTITAEFPNATNHSEIEEAFNNLANRATQYANRKVG